MKRKILCMLLALAMVLGLAANVCAYPNIYESTYEDAINDTLWDAQPIELGVTYDCHPVAYCGDSDLFTFTLEEAAQIRISMASRHEAADLALFDGEGKLLANGTHLGVYAESFELFNIFPMELAAGTYYVGIWITDNTNSCCMFEVNEGVFNCEGYHLFYVHQATVPATCQSEGVMTSTCLCGATETETVPADPNAHTWNIEIVTPATCTENGLARHTCTGCGAVEEEILWAEHSAPGKIIIQEPTGDDYGMYYFTCADCGFVDEKEEHPLYPLDHMFIDVEPNSFYELPVCWAIYKKITDGTDAYHFSPNAEANRAQVVTFLWRAAGCPEPTLTESPFTDVQDEEAYYYKAVLWACENEITDGMTDTTFVPDGKCTRAQVVTFLWRTNDKPESTAEVTFTDVKPEQFYTDAVAWAYEKGITDGVEDGIFGVDLTCTRAQVVTFLYRSYVN